MTPRYRETPWTLTARLTPSGARVWYYFYYDERGKRWGPKTTGIGYRKDRDKARTKKEAAEYCAALFRSGRLGSSAEGVTLDAWVERQRFFEWERSKWVRGILARAEQDKAKLTEGYVKRAGAIYRDRIEPFHGGIVIDGIGPSDCEDLLLGTWKAEGKKNKTLNNWRSVYSTIMAEAARLNVIERNPWESVQQLSVSSERRGGLTIAEGNALLQLPADTGNDRVYALATKTAMMTGLRLSEVAGLLVSDVKSNTRNVNGVEITNYYIDCTRQWSAGLKKRVPVKDKDARAVPILPGLFDELTGRRKQGEFVFSLRPDNDYPIPINRLEEWFNARVESLGVDRKARKVTFHSTRRFFNTLLRRRVSGDVLRKMTGHDSDEMTEHYTDYLPEDLAAITEAQRSLTDG
jgi:integrase